MHGGAPPPFDGEEAGFVMKTMLHVISWDIPEQFVAVLQCRYTCTPYMYMYEGVYSLLISSKQCCPGIT